MPLRIATRKSPLAVWQAEYVAACLRAIDPALDVVLVKMTTQGDRILDTPLAQIGGKGLFVKELEDGLLRDEADIAVHSMKDVPAQLPEGLMLGAILEREDPRDAWISPRYPDLDSLPSGAHIGTASLRRQCQLLARRPDVRITALRGNVNSRLAKLDEGQFDAIILAAAGLIRLGFGTRIRRFMAPEESLPAVGQGALGIECRSHDNATRERIAALEHLPTRRCVEAERAVNARLFGGCQVPLAAHATLQGDNLTLRALVAHPDGRNMVRGSVVGPSQHAPLLGRALADDLRLRGGQAVIDALSQSHA
jgi:hydroxymethylbilane synthase